MGKRKSTRLQVDAFGMLGHAQTEKHVCLHREACKERASLAMMIQDRENKLFCEEHLHNETNIQLICQSKNSNLKITTDTHSLL